MSQAMDYLNSLEKLHKFGRGKVSAYNNLKIKRAIEMKVYLFYFLYFDERIFVSKLCSFLLELTLTSVSGEKNVQSVNGGLGKR